MQLRVHQFSLRSNRSYCKGNEAKALCFFLLRNANHLPFPVYTVRACAVQVKEENSRFLEHLNPRLHPSMKQRWSFLTLCYESALAFTPELQWSWTGSEYLSLSQANTPFSLQGKKQILGTAVSCQSLRYLCYVRSL